ncbi:MAG TPA: Gfo/Idh/MocA family oxidoreductase [Caulobacteraceae bacterium]|jgi:predicted dehydrogenase|nr:Gfo/Idh/MocA family oxidoreductase [Caulobacteraceae bacterium]
MTEDLVRYNHEYDARVRACFVGAGGHAFRNVYPTFRYAPVDLLAICDLDETRARAYARQFGAERTYADHRRMFEAERPDAVFIVTSYEPDGAIQSTEIALAALAAGAHVWMEKPAAASSAEVARLAEASERAGRFVMTGLKKVFFPTIEKAKSIVGSAAFGQPTSIYVRYPQSMPPFAERGDAVKMLGLLDHIYHPAAILHYLMGPIERLTYEWEPRRGASVAALRFASGAVGVLHLAAGASGVSPLERLEVVGEGSNLVVDNGARLTWYRKGRTPSYGRAASFLVDDAAAPLHWEPEFSLGQLYNNNLFTLGYAQEVRHFCDCVLAGAPPTRGTLADVAQIVKLFETFRTTDAGRTVVLGER